MADYVGSALAASNRLGVKCINAGGARPHSNTMCGPSVSMTSCLSMDSPHAKSSRRCSRRDADLKVPHPLHLHCNNLGIPGNVATAIATIDGGPRQAAASRASAVLCLWSMRAGMAFRPRAAALAAKVNADAECHGRCWSGHVPADGDHLRRRAAAVQRRRHGQSQEIRHQRRRCERRRHRALSTIGRAISTMRCNGLAGSNCFCSSMIRGRSSSRPTTQMARHSRPILRFSR